MIPCCLTQHVFFCIVMTDTMTTKKRKNSPYHSSFFLSPLLRAANRSGAGSSPIYGCLLISSLLRTFTMIRKNSLFCKLIRIKTSSKSIFDSFMIRFRPELETCPVCGAKGHCRIHDYYGRHMIDFREGAPAKDNLCILRVYCDSCEHVHAILPDFIIPYSSGSRGVLRMSPYGGASL